MSQVKYFGNFDEFICAMSDAVKTTARLPESHLRALTDNLRNNSYFGAFQEILILQKAECGPETENGQLIANENKNISNFLVERNQILDANIRDCFNIDAEIENNETKNSSVDNSHFLRHLNNIQQEMRNCIQYYEEAMSNMHSDVERLIVSARKLLWSQRNFRPITMQDIENFVQILQVRATYWENQLKVITCNRLMLLKAQLNYGRKRRNFTKNATKILNEYFEAHMSEPYPTEQTKIRLAKQCGITVAQVSNWFGNKRIRFRKAFLRKSLESKQANE